MNHKQVRLLVRYHCGVTYRILAYQRYLTETFTGICKNEYRIYPKY